MAVTPQGLLSAAETLGEGRTEPDWRNAASRAYYAAFHRCRLIAADLGPLIAASAHREVIDTLSSTLRPMSMRSLGIMLEQCRRHRVIADYELKTDFTRETAHTVLETSRAILIKADAIS